MPPLLAAYAAASLLVLAVHAFGCVGIIRAMVAEHRHRGARASEAPRPSVEVVVVARNEERTLPGLLACLGRQSDRRCAFLLVDDRSTDGTLQLLERFRASLPQRVRVLRNEEEPEGMTGKQAALDLAFAAARGEVLLFTDGDCQVPERWVEEMGSWFADPGVGVVLGRIEPEEGTRFCTRFQAFEQPLINQYNIAIAGLGGGSGCFGNSLAARREAVLATGGFRAIGWSVTEDSALLTAILAQRRWKVRAALSADATVRTAAKPDWRSFVNQHTRWNAGAIHARDLVTRLAYLLVIVVYLPLTLVVAPLAVLDPRVALLSLTSTVSVGSFGLLGGLYPGIRRRRYYLRLLPYLLFFLFFYSYVTWRAVLARPFEWKGRRMRG